MRIRRVALALLLFPPSAAAQVVVNGVLRPVPGPTICFQGETHVLECTSVFLKSGTIDLNGFVGQTVRVTGPDVGLHCTLIEATSVLPAGVTLSFSGTPTPGGTVTLTTCVFNADSPYYFAVFASPSSGYLPLDRFLGTILLCPPIVLVEKVYPNDRVVGSAGFCLDLPVKIRSDLSLVGASVWLQAYGTGSFVTQLSNAICLTIA